MAFVRVNCFSSSLGMSVNCNVILPQKARGQIGIASADGTGRNTENGTYPVLWLLHGMSDDESMWERRTSIERYISPLGIVVVMPSAQLSGYSNMAHGGAYYDFISKELPETMRDFFSISEKREDNFIAGLSMGGEGAIKIGLANPQKYAAIGCLSAGVINHPWIKNPDPVENKREFMRYGDRNLTDTEEDGYRNAERILKDHLPAPRVYHAVGQNDFLLNPAREMRDFFLSFKGNPFDYRYEEDPGTHTWEFWDLHIQHFLSYLSEKAHPVNKE